MDFPERLTRDEYELFKKELRLTLPYETFIQFENRAVYSETIRTDEKEIKYSLGLEDHCWHLQFIRDRRLTWKAYEIAGESIVNVNSIKKLELYSEDIDGEEI